MTKNKIYIGGEDDIDDEESKLKKRLLKIGNELYDFTQYMPYIIKDCVTEECEECLKQYALNTVVWTYENKKKDYNDLDYAKYLLQVERLFSFEPPPVIPKCIECLEKIKKDIVNVEQRIDEERKEKKEMKQNKKETREYKKEKRDLYHEIKLTCGADWRIKKKCKEQFKDRLTELKNKKKKVKTYKKKK